VHVGVMVEQIILHRCNDRARHLSAARAIEVGDRMVVVSSLQSRELRSEE
jgi:hypothetical protein